MRLAGQLCHGVNIGSSDVQTHRDRIDAAVCCSMTFHLAVARLARYDVQEAKPSALGETPRFAGLQKPHLR